MNNRTWTQRHILRSDSCSRIRAAGFRIFPSADAAFTCDPVPLSSSRRLKAETTFSLKDQLFNEEKVNFLAKQFAATKSGFPAKRFSRNCVEAFPDLELKERISHITACLHDALPDDYPKALSIILEALPAQLDPTLRDDDFGDFIIAPLSHYVAVHGCSRKHVRRSLRALREITKRFSAEDAIRYFINAFPEETLAFLESCTDDDNYHVRRLASEGTRPKLPWSQKLAIDFREPLPILEKLYRDPTRYVTRSVANHVNDISKVDPATAIKVLRRWGGRGGSARRRSSELQFVTKHALRTLVKQGNADALALLGFSSSPDITIRDFKPLTPVVKIGSALEFVLKIRSNKAQPLLLDYVMDFAPNSNATGRKTGGRKVFKLTQIEMKAGEQQEILKKHPLRLMTTRRLYEGDHTVTLQVNGRASKQFSFVLEA